MNFIIEDYKKIKNILNRLKVFDKFRHFSTKFDKSSKIKKNLTCKMKKTCETLEK